MSKTRVSLIYFVVIIATLIVRIVASLGVPSMIGLDGDIFFTVATQVFCFGILPFCFYLALLRQKSRKIANLCSDFGFRRPKLKYIVLSVFIAFFMMHAATLVSFVWQGLITFFGFTAIPPEPTDFSNIGLLFLELFLVALLPGFFEEFANRGLILAGYRDSGWRYIVLSALMFSLMHQNIRQTGYTFFDGLVIATVVLLTKNCWYGVIIHFVNNAVSVLQSYGSQQGGFLGFFAKISDFFYGSILGFAVLALTAVIALVLVVFLLWALQKWTQGKNIVQAIKSALVSRSSKGYLDFGSTQNVDHNTGNATNTAIANLYINTEDANHNMADASDNTENVMSTANAGIFNNTAEVQQQTTDSSTPSPTLDNGSGAYGSVLHGTKEQKRKAQKAFLCDNWLMILTGAVGVVATLFSFVWGVLR